MKLLSEGMGIPVRKEYFSSYVATSNPNIEHSLLKRWPTFCLWVVCLTSGFLGPRALVNCTSQMNHEIGRKKRNFCVRVLCLARYLSNPVVRQYKHVYDTSCVAGVPFKTRGRGVGS